MNSFRRHGVEDESSSHLQPADVGFHPGLRISAHRRLSATALMEKKIHSPFDLGSAESAARPNFCPALAGQSHAEYRRLRRLGARRCERRETAPGFGNALHYGSLTVTPVLRSLANGQSPGTDAFVCQPGDLGDSFTASEGGVVPSPYRFSAA